MTIDTTAEISSLPAVISLPEELFKELRRGLTARAVHEAVQDGADTLPGVTALHEDVRVHDLEGYLPQRRRQRGQFLTPYVSPFVEYAKTYANAGAMVFVDASEMRARAVLDLGTTDAPGHADHTAQLQLRPTAAFDALRQFAGRPHKQQAVAEFLEDWAPHVGLTLFSGDEEIKLGQALSAVRRITIESMRKLDSEEQQLSVNRTAFESVQASSRDPLPTTIDLSAKPYADLGVRTFRLRLSIHTGGDAPMLTLRIQNMETHTEEMGEELAGLVREQVGEEMPVLLGNYSKHP